jgi:hypothetical protein
MSFKEKSAFCSMCNKQVLVRKQTPKHCLAFSDYVFYMWLLANSLASYRRKKSQ